MLEKLLLFDDELEKLKQTGWDYQILYKVDEKRIYVVKTNIPDKIFNKKDMIRE